MEYEFTRSWFQDVEPIWETIFKNFMPDPTRIMEIGCYEGRATVWLMEHAFKGAGALHCVDPWQDYRELKHTSMTEVEHRWLRNTGIAKQRFPKISLYQHKMPSHRFLAQAMLDEDAPYDFIYVDGAHDTANALTDLVMAFHCCRPGGIICCDDYLMDWGLPQTDLRKVPKMAIDAAITCFHEHFAIMQHAPLYQIYLMRRT